MRGRGVETRKPVLQPTEPASKQFQRRRSGRIVLVLVGIGALVAMVAPDLMRKWMARDFCPTEVTARGEEGGVAWDVARSTCAPGRIVWQLRVVPAKGVSTLAYEAEGGPAPAFWRQTGFSGEVHLAEPLASGETVLPMILDLKGRPMKPIRARAGARVD